MGDDSRYLAAVRYSIRAATLLVTAKLNALKVAERNGDLMQNVNFALKASIIASFLDINGVRYVPGSDSSDLRPEELADRAKSMSVFILCN
jgi:serine protease Do